MELISPSKSNLNKSFSQILKSRSVNKLNSPGGDGTSLFLSRAVYFEHLTLQEGMAELDGMIQRAINRDDKDMRDKFLVQQNRLSRKEKEIFDKESDLKGLEMELNSNPQIKRDIFDLAQLKEFNIRKENQYTVIQQVISKEDESLKSLKNYHEELIKKLKKMISISIETQMCVKKIQAYLKHRHSQGSPPKIISRKSKPGIIITDPEYLNSSKLHAQPNRLHPIPDSLSMLSNITSSHRKQVLIADLSTNSQANCTMNNSFSSKHIIQAIQSNMSQYNQNTAMSSFILTKAKPHHQTSCISPSPYNQNSTVATTLNRINFATRLPSQEKRYFPSPNQIQSSKQRYLQYQDTTLQQTPQLIQLQADYEEIQRQILVASSEIERKKKKIFKYCNESFEKNSFIKDCFVLASKKLSNQSSMSFQTGLPDSMYLTIRKSNPFIKQKDQFLEECTHIKNSHTISVQDRQLANIVFDSMLNFLKKKEHNLNSQNLPAISYDKFSQFSFDQIMTLLSLLPEIKERLLIPFQIKKQITHLLLTKVQNTV